MATLVVGGLIVSAGVAVGAAGVAGVSAYVYKRKHKEDREQEPKVFGYRLEEIPTRFLRPSGIPTVFEKCCIDLESRLDEVPVDDMFMMEEDIERVEELSQLFEQKGKVRKAIKLSKEPPDVVGSLLKYFISSLPEPLTTYDLFESFVATHERHERDIESWKIEMSKVLMRLPTQNKLVFYRLLSFLSKAVASSEKIASVDCSKRLADTFSPLVFQPRDVSQWMRLISVPVLSEMLCLMILYHPELQARIKANSQTDLSIRKKKSLSVRR